MVALGVSGIGDVQGAFVQNTKKLPEYYAAIEEDAFRSSAVTSSTDDDLVRRHVITRLMCNFRATMREVERRFRDRVRQLFRGRTGRA